MFQPGSSTKPTALSSSKSLTSGDYEFFASGGQGEGAWRLALGAQRQLYYSLCALRFARIPLQKLLIKAVMVCSLKKSLCKP
jgi:hypothetical protein